MRTLRRLRERLSASRRAAKQRVAERREAIAAAERERSVRQLMAPPAPREFVSAETAVPFGVRAAAAWSWRLILVAVGVYACFRVVLFFAPVLFPFFIAILLAALLAPLVNAAERARLPRGLAVFATVLVALSVLGGLLTLVGTQFIAGLQGLATQTGSALQELTKAIRHSAFAPWWEQLAHKAGSFSLDKVGMNGSLVGAAASVTGTAGHVFSGFVIVFFCLIFLLHDGRGVWLWVVGLLPRGARDATDQAASKGWLTLSSFVRATMVVAAADGLGVGIGAALLGVPLAIPIAVMVFMGALIPFIGAIVTGGVAVLVAFVSKGVFGALAMLAIVIGVQQFESHVMQPLLLGRAVQVHPIAVMLSIGAGLQVGGVMGALFAVPTVAVANVMVSELVRGADRARAIEVGSADPDPAHEGSLDRHTMADTSDTVVPGVVDVARVSPAAESEAQ